MIAKLFFILIFFVLIFLATLTMYDLKELYYNFENLFLKFSIGVVAVVTFFIIVRYMMFIIFSIIKTTQKTAEEEVKDKKHLRVSIIVPAYNEEVTIATTIKSLVKQTYHDLEIIIVNDGSVDNTYQIAKKFEGKFEGKDIRVFSKRNAGKSQALNYAIDRSSGDLIMCVDADSKLDNTAVELMARYFNDNEIVAVAGSVFVNNRVNVLTKLQALEYIEGLNMVRNGQAFLKLVNIIPGPIGMFRKESVIEVGGYKDDTFAEDADLTLRLIKKNYKIEFEADAVSRTEAPEGLLDLLKQRYRWTRGILQSIRKHRRSLFSKEDSGRWDFTIVLWYMLFEAILWPFMDLFATVLLIYISFAQGSSTIIFYWWSLFTIVDIAAALYCIFMTNESKKLALYSIYYRLYYISIINISKIFATIEEWLNIKMSWQKIDRKGGI